MKRFFTWLVQLTNRTLSLTSRITDAAKASHE
jgi:hypothetical protein